jgi:hypothetical protein
VLPNHRWLDRIVRGRAWIPMLGVLLVAIVGLRVEVLKLGSSVGSDVAEVSTLQAGNQVLRSRISELSGNQRIEQLAGEMGMVMPGPMDIHFVQASTAKQVAGAIRSIQAPETTTFLNGLATEREADTSNPITTTDTGTAVDQGTDSTGTAVDGSTSDTASTATSTTDPTTDASTTDASTTDSTSGGTPPATDATGATDTGATDTGATDVTGTADATGTEDTTGATDPSTGTDQSSGTDSPSTTAPIVPANGGSALAG